MNEEEKQAIEFLNEQLDKEENDDFCPVCLHNYLVVVLDLIKRQQKEIEEKTTIIMAGAEKVKQLEEEIEELKLITRQYNSYCINTDDDEPRIILAHKHYFDSGVFTSNYISKDKIRELLKSKDIKLTGVISYRELEELLEE